ncbi:hypothetical protein [Kibdelosporangium aridum]|nr:hypothetical protein [Kibdelosporangium aridum]
MFQEMHAADPMSGRAMELVKEALERPPAVELLRGFLDLAKVIKFHGDIARMKILVSRCLQLLRTSQELMPDDCDRELIIRTCGKVWYLCCEQRLDYALEEAHRSIRIAESRVNQRRTLAHARKYVGEIARRMAEESTGHDRTYRLDTSANNLREAMALFSAIDGDYTPESEVGVCLLLLARTQLVRYRLLGDQAALAEAEQLADQVVGMDQVESYDRDLFLAEIAAAKGRYAESKDQLGHLIETLITLPGAYAEVLARAYCARARIDLERRVRGAKTWQWLTCVSA